MATGFKVGAVDLDDYFDPYIEGEKPAETGYKVGAVDLNQRYAPLQYGQQAAATGMKIAGGVDLNALWAKKGTASYSIVGLNGKTLAASDQALTNQQFVSATVSVTISDNGRWAVSGGISHGAISQPAPESGAWLRPGESVGDYQVKFAVSVAGDGQVENEAATYSDLSTARNLSFSLPRLIANNEVMRSGHGTVTVNLKHIPSGRISETLVYMNLMTLGWR